MVLSVCVWIMNTSRGDRSDSDTGQQPMEQAASNDSSWGQGSASALESLKKREQRRDHTAPRRDDDDHPHAADGATTPT